jgi:drug/metabolite transporter (DMT)-like permease
MRVKGPALLLAGIVSFSLLDALGKLLSATYPVAQAIFLRWLVVVALILAAKQVWPALGGPLRTGLVRLHAIRSTVMIFSAAGFYLGFRNVPLAEGYLVFFTAPFMTLALTPWLLKEHVPGAAWLWSAVGFAGVAVSVVQGLGAGGSLTGYLFILMGTACFALTQVLNRKMRSEPGWARMVFWGALLGVIAYGPLAAVQWVPPTPAAWAMLAANGLFAAAGVVLSALAYQASDPARLGPYGFTALPCAVLLDLAIWGQAPDWATIAGGGIVVFAVVMSERARRRAALVAVAGPTQTSGPSGPAVIGPGQGMLAGKTWSPSAASGSGSAARTAESGSTP